MLIHVDNKIYKIIHAIFISIKGETVGLILKMLRNLHKVVTVTFINREEVDERFKRFLMMRNSWDTMKDIKYNTILFCMSI